MNHRIDHAPGKTRVGLALVAVALLGVGCASHDTRLTDDATLYLGTGGGIVQSRTEALHDTVSYWDGDGVGGSPRVVISLGRQEARFYKGGQLVGISKLSTGREGYETPTGSFKVTQKSPDHRSNLYGDYVDGAGNVVVSDVDVRKDPKPPGTTFRGAPMPYFMRIHGGVGLHAGFLPGFPASHGCIRMPEHMARVFYHNVSVGTPVEVIN